MRPAHQSSCSRTERPMIDPLDRRLVYSASASEIVVPPPAPPTADEVLVTLAQGEAKVMGDEVAVLNAAGNSLSAGDGAVSTYNRLTEALHRLTDATYGLGGAVVTSAAKSKVKLSDFHVTSKIDKASATLMEAQNDVVHLGSALGLANTENSALGSLLSDSAGLADTLTANPPLAGSVSQDELVRFNQVSNTLDTFDGDVLQTVAESRKGKGGGKAGRSTWCSSSSSSP